jgi:hypothetical protein
MAIGLVPLAKRTVYRCFLEFIEKREGARSACCPACSVCLKQEEALLWHLACLVPSQHSRRLPTLERDVVC